MSSPSCKHCGTPNLGLHKIGCPDSGESRIYVAKDDGYGPLRRVLDAAYDQAAKGKGKERHANARPFDQQPILEITRMVGIGGPSFQAMKKIQEANGMVHRGSKQAAINELYGAIIYAAAAVLALEESIKTD